MKKNLLWRWAWRELFHGQLWPVVAALALIIACVFALSALASRIEGGLTAQGRKMLAADLVLKSNAPLPDAELKKITALGATVSAQTAFGTMAFSQDKMQLIQVKAVESNYPLRGDLGLANADGVKTNVDPGELWVEKRVLTLLDANIGDVIDVGNLKIKISGVIAQEPELSFNPFDQMPAALMHQADVDAAGVVRPGSRVNYRYFFNATEAQLRALKANLTLAEGQRWLDESSNNRTGEMLERSRSYLALTVVLVIIMAAATLLLTCQHYVQSRTQTLAMVKSLGASKKWVMAWLAKQLAMLLIFSSVFGLGIGVLLEYVLRLPLVDILPSPLPSYGITPFLLGPLVALLVALPALGIPLVRLVNASAQSVLQPQSRPQARYHKANALLIAMPVLCLALWSFDNKLVWLVLVAMIGMLALLAVIGFLALKFAQRKVRHPSIKLALSRIVRSPKASSLQLGALAISFMLLAIIWLLRTDLLQDWQQTLPQDAPNVFALNIAGSELDPYLGALDKQQLIRSEAYPIIRGRLVGINGERYSELAPDLDDRDESLNRELNLTWRDALPTHNELLAGTWPTAGGVSIEQGVADRLNIKLGDELIFNINSQDIHAKVNSIRGVEWRNMRPNFYFIFDPQLVANLPANWLVSFRVTAEQTALLNQLGREYPTVTLLDLRTISARVQVILRQINMSLSVLAGLAVISGLLLLLTLLRLTLGEREQEIMLYRTLGAAKSRIRTTLWAEYGLMALVSGCIAAAGAELALAVVLKWGLTLPMRLHFELWLVLPLLAVVLVFATVAGMLKRLLKPLTR